MSSITAVIHTCDSNRTLARCLESVSWCDALLVADMSSVDGSREVARTFGAKIVDVPRQPWSDALRNSVLDHVVSPWILVIDSDEFLAVDAEQVLRGFVSTAPANVDALAIPRYNYICGRVLNTARWYPDRQVRLMRTDKAMWVAKHHVGVHVRGEISQGDLDSIHIHHDSYDSLAAFYLKQAVYASTDHYESEWDPHAYIQRSLEMLGADGVDDDLSRALDLLLACNEISRAIVHWDKIGRGSQSLPQALTLPIRFLGIPLDNPVQPALPEAPSNTGQIRSRLVAVLPRWARQTLRALRRRVSTLG
jgi:glycosyltransferase involved in cell wall biosynthesis